MAQAEAAIGADDHADHTPSFFVRWFFSTNHKDIGTLYLILAIIGEVISLVVGCWLLYWAWDFATYAWRIWKESPTLYIPTFFADCALVAGLALMMIFTFRHLLRHLADLRKGDAQ